MLCLFWVQEGNEVSLAMKRLRQSVGSRPASDTDDTMWEELLQGSDSVSTGTSDSEGNGRYNAGVTLPQTSNASSDDERLQQGITGVRPEISITVDLPKEMLVVNSCSKRCYDWHHLAWLEQIYGIQMRNLEVANI